MGVNAHDNSIGIMLAASILEMHLLATSIRCRISRKFQQVRIGYPQINWVITILPANIIFLVLYIIYIYMIINNYIYIYTQSYITVYIYI